MACLDTGRGRPPQRTRLAVVADDDHDTTIDAALCARVEDRLKRRTFVARALRFAAFTSYATSGGVVPSIARRGGRHVGLISGFGYASGGTRQELSGIRMEVERPKVFAALKLWTLRSFLPTAGR